MEKHVFEGKEIEEIKKQIEDTLQVEENDYYMTIDESKTGFLKGKKLVVEVITKKEVLDFIKKYLQTIAKYMELEFRVETKVRENMEQAFENSLNEEISTEDEAKDSANEFEEVDE